MWLNSPISGPRVVRREAHQVDAAAFAAAVEDGIYKTSGNKVSVIDVDAQDAGGRRTRRLLASSVDVTFKVS